MSTDWSPAPTTAAGALDQIAALSPTSQTNGPLGPAGTVTFTTTNISVSGSAKYVVSARFNAFGSTSTTSAAVTLGIDGTPGTILDSGSCQCSSANGPMVISLFAAVTVSRPGPHTYTVQGIATGGVLTVSAGGIVVVVMPFGG